MRLVLSFDPAWRVLDAPDHRRVAIGPNLVVTFGPLELESERSLLSVDVPAATRVRIVRTEDRQTRDGWPLRLVDAEIVAVNVTAATTAVEARCYACFRFLAYTAVAIVRAADLAAIDTHRASLVATFDRGRPDWRNGPLCLADAYSFDAANLCEAREIESFGADGFEVLAIETLRPRDPTCHPVLAFHALRDGEPLAVSVLVEISDRARAANTPYVIAVVGATYRVVGTHASLPRYTELKRQILPLLIDAVQAISR